MPHKTLEELKNAISDASNIVYVGSMYMHSKTKSMYKVNGLSVLESSEEIVVRYSPVNQLDIEFMRPVSEFTEQVNIDGSLMPRFQMQES